MLVLGGSERGEHGQAVKLLQPHDGLVAASTGDELVHLEVETHRAMDALSESEFVWHERDE